MSMQSHDFYSNSMHFPSGDEVIEYGQNPGILFSGYAGDASNRQAEKRFEDIVSVFQSYFPDIEVKKSSSNFSFVVPLELLAEGNALSDELAIKEVCVKNKVWRELKISLSEVIENYNLFKERERKVEEMQKKFAEIGNSLKSCVNSIAKFFHINIDSSNHK